MDKTRTSKRTFELKFKRETYRMIHNKIVQPGTGKILHLLGNKPIASFQIYFQPARFPVLSLAKLKTTEPGNFLVTAGVITRIETNTAI
jgi:hypothetical protein